MRKKGISLVALVCTMAVTLILLVTIGVSFNNIYQSTKKKEFANEIYSIQKLVEDYYFRNNKYPILNGSINIDLSMLDLEANQFIAETRNLTDTITLKPIDLYEAGVQETNRGQQKNGNVKDIYLVSEKTGIVYYLKGEEIGSKIYYALNDELKREIGLLK